MLKTLESVDWASVTHAYGTAEDVPALLRGVTSPDSTRVERSFYELYGNVFHQGARFEASRFVVPVLFEIMALVPPPLQSRVLSLFAALALGDTPPSDESLPFRREVAFAAAEGVSAADVAPVYRRVLAHEDLPDDTFIDTAVTVWARDTYDAASCLAPELLAWAESTDAGVAALAYSLTPWFPCLGARAERVGVELLASRPELRVTTLVTLGLLRAGAALGAIHEQLRLAADPVLRAAAAIAIGLIAGPETSEDALSTLLHAERWRPELDDASSRLPFARTLNGYVAKAIARVEG